MSSTLEPAPRTQVYHPCNAQRRLIAKAWNRIFAFTVMVILMTSMTLAHAHAQSAHDPGAPLSSLHPGEVINESALILTNDAKDRFLAPLMETDLTIEVSGLTASVILRQSFTNASQEWMEGHYQFPLPEQAAVHRMVMVIGERRIVGEIKEKQTAKKIYEQAKQLGKRTSLVSQQRPNMFTNKVANIGPQETISVEIHYVETLKYDRGEFSLRFPTTFTPRYIPPIENNRVADALDRSKTESDTIATPSSLMTVDPHTGWLSTSIKAEDHLNISPQFAPSHEAPPIRLTAKVDSGFPLEYIHSLFHPIDYDYKAGQYHIRFQQEKVLMNRDIVLRWKPALNERINAALFKETIDQDDYHLLMLLPNTQVGNIQRLPREIVFVIDTSGSMSGVSIRQAKTALLEGLQRLQPSDRFNVIDFSDRARNLFPKTVNVNKASLSKATAYINKLRADGGTQLSKALDLALRNQENNRLLRQVVLITDASIGNEDALFAQITRDLGKSRLFTVGIGPAPNSHFMRDAAQIGRGTFTHIGSINDVSFEIAQLFEKLEYPVLSNIALDWGVDMNKAELEVFPKRIPDLYLSEPLMLYFKSPSDSFKNGFKGGFKNPLSVSGEFAGGRWQQKLALDTKKQQAGIAKQWARQKIRALLSPRNPASAQDKKQQVTDVALEHQLLSRYTSFVAVETLPARPAQSGLEKAFIPNAMPQGNTMAMPNTATPSKLYLLFGFMFLLLSLYQSLRLRAAS